MDICKENDCLTHKEKSKLSMAGCSCTYRQLMIFTKQFMVGPGKACKDCQLT